MKRISFTTLGFIFSAILVLAICNPAQGGECPAATSVTKLSGSSGFQKKGPFDPKTVTKAAAAQTDKGLVVFLSNVAIDAKAAAPKLPMPPVMGKSNVAIILTFRNGGKTVPGTYEPKGAGDPMRVTSDLAFGFEAGGMIDSFTGNTGKAQITDLSDTKVCGSFDIQGSEGSVAGVFSAPIVK